MKRARFAVLTTVIALFLAAPLCATTTQLLLGRDTNDLTGEYKGVVELTINPGVEDAKVTVTVDGQKIAEALRSPYKVTIDFGNAAVEHKIGVTVWAGKKRVQWSETINKGMLPLRVNLKSIDYAARLFEAFATSPKDDPIAAVELWDGGQLVTSVTESPYRFTVPQSVMDSGFVQVTAKTRSGDEAADFWSVSGDVHVESVDVRTVPIFVSVVDRDGVTHDNVDRSLFRILDNDAEAKIIEFKRAFDQPISIGLLLDASASMTYAIDDVAKAAQSFLDKTLKPGDRCTVFAIKDVPRRQQEITADRELIRQAIAAIKPQGRTALYDAITSAIREMKDEKSRRAIVALTDGADTASMATYEEVTKIAKAAGIPLYFIAFEGSDDPDQLQELDRLKFLASETGGFVTTASQKNLVAKYEAIEKDLRAQFAIRYQVTDYAKRNEWRRVRVMLSSPKLTARTIRGYFAP